MGELTPAQRFNRISKCGLCIGCGICQSIAGQQVVRMQITDQGYERPVVQGELSDAVVDTIYDVCPGTRVEGLPESLHDQGTVSDAV